MPRVYKTCPIREGNRDLYKRWIQIRQRIYNPNNSSYKRYGGKGIKFCKEWDDFINFYKWAMSHGFNKSLTIDRIDGNGDYTPNNCRWVSMAINQRNKKHRDDVWIYKKKGGYFIQITYDHKYYYGGYFNDIKEARIRRNTMYKDIDSGRGYLYPTKNRKGCLWMNTEKNIGGRRAIKHTNNILI